MSERIVRKHIRKHQQKGQLEFAPSKRGGKRMLTNMLEELGGEYVGYNEKGFDDVEMDILLSNIRSIITPLQYKVLSLLLVGNTQVQVANILHIKQPRVHRIVKAIRRKISGMLGGVESG